MSKEKYLEVKANWCKRCYFCVEFCPKGVFKIAKNGLPEPVELDKCTECRLCISLCPDFAIFTNPQTKKEFEGR